MLPLSANRAYSGAVPVVPGDLNDFQDCFIAGKHGQIKRHLTADRFVSIGGGAGALTGVGGAGGNPISWTGIGNFFCGLLLHQGNRIHSLTFGHNRAGFGQIDFYIRRQNLSTNAHLRTLLGSVAAGAVYATTSFAEAAIQAAISWSVLPANEAVALEVVHSNAANVFGGAVVEYSKP